MRPRCTMAVMRSRQKHHPNHSPLARAFAAGLVLVGLGLSVVACSPARRNNVAIFLQDGQPTALLHPCPGEAVTELSVTDLTTPSAPRPGDQTSTHLYVPHWAVSAAEEDARPTQVRLLTVPPGWVSEPDVAFELREFRPGYRYRLGTGQVGAHDVEFTLADLEALAEDQVWISEGGQERAVERDEFIRIAESSCG